MIVVVGDLLLDIFLLSELPYEEQSAGLIARAGGSAANTAAWLAHLGAPTTFVGCTGEDLVGAALMTEMESRGIVTAIQKVVGAETGMVAIQVTDDGERLMRSSRGANQYLNAEALTRRCAVAPSAVHLTGYSLLAPAGLDLLRAARSVALGGLLSLDPSSCSVVRRVGARNLLRSIVDNSFDLLLPNASEALALAESDTVEESAQRLTEYAPVVIVKDGAAGAFWATPSAHGRAKAPRVRPLDTTGAGDAFDAGVLLSLTRGRNPATAARAGNRLAASALVRYGGRPPDTSAASESGKPA